MASAIAATYAGLFGGTEDNFVTQKLDSAGRQRGHLNQVGKDTAMPVHLFRCIGSYCGFEKGDNRDC